MAKQTQDLVNKPDAKLLEIIEAQQADALQTQSESYIYLTCKEHEDIYPGDIVEVRCAPDPRVRARGGTPEGEMPPPRSEWGGFVLAHGDKLFRNWFEVIAQGEGDVGPELRQRVTDDPTMSIERPAPSSPVVEVGQEQPGADKWQVVRWYWTDISPSWRDRALAPETDVQLRVFEGADLQNGWFDIHPDMAAGDNPPKNN